MESPQRLNVFFFPGNPTFNPYWEILGKTITSEFPYVKLFKTSIQHCDLRTIGRFARDKCVIHIHWLPEYQRRASGENYLAAKLRVGFSYAVLFANFLLMTYMKLFRGAEIIWTIHNADRSHIRPAWTKFFSRWTEALSCAYIFHCKNSEEDFFQKVKRKPSFVIPHGNYIGIFGPIIREQGEARMLLGIPKDAIVLLVLGIIRRAKNLEELLKKLYLLPHKNVRVVIAGQPVTKADRLMIEKYMDRADGRFIILPRFVPEPQLRWFLSAADYLLNAQTRGYVSGSSITALSYGLPVLCYKWGCASSLIEHGVNGFLFSYKNLYQVIDEAIELKYDRERYTAMRQAAYESAERLEWNHIAKQTVDAYMSMFEHEGRST